MKQKGFTLFGPPLLGRRYRPCRFKRHSRGDNNAKICQIGSGANNPVDLFGLFTIGFFSGGFMWMSGSYIKKFRARVRRFWFVCRRKLVNCHFVNMVVGADVGESHASGESVLNEEYT
jgi:hypothetical protein